MSRKTFSKKGDLYAATVSIGIGLMAIYAFFSQGNGSIDSAYSMEVEVGDLSSPTRGVRYRLNKSIAWQDVPSSQKKKIRIGDEVFTTSQSTASLALKNGTEFTIAPNSYVAFERPETAPGQPESNRPPVLSMKRGRIDIRMMPGGNSPVLISVAGKTYSIDSTRVNQTSLVTVVVDEKADQPVLMQDNVRINAIEEVRVVQSEVAVESEKLPLVENGENSETTVRFTLSSVSAPAKVSAEAPVEAAVTQAPVERAPVERAPAARESDPVVEPDPDAAKSSITAGLGGTYFRIDGIDPSALGKSVVLSELSPKLELQWNLDWDERNTFSFFGSLERFTLKSFKNTQTLSSTRGVRSAMGFGYTRHWSERLTLGAALQLRESIFFQSSSPTVLDVNTVLIVNPGLNLRFELLHKSNASFGLIGDLGFLFPTDAGDYTIRSGFAGSTGLFLQYRGKSDARGMEGQIFYRYESQDSSISTRVETQLGMRLLYFWRLD